jgi:hypothetical protein
MALITLQVFNSAVQANYWKSQIESKGIVCFVYDEHMSTLYPGGASVTGGIKLKINESDINVVKEMFPGLLLSHTQELRFCPKCHSVEVERLVKESMLGQLLEAFKSFIALVAPKSIKQHFRCRNCDNQFTSV